MRWEGVPSFGGIKVRLHLLVLEYPPFSVIIGCLQLKSLEACLDLRNQSVPFGKGENFLNFVLDTILVTVLVIQIAKNSLLVQTGD